MAREERLVLKIDPIIKEKFQKLSADYGMTMSAFGAYAIGRLVREEETKHQLNDKAIEMTLKQGLENAQKFYTDEKLMSMFAPLIREMMDQQKGD